MFEMSWNDPRVLGSPGERAKRLMDFWVITDHKHKGRCLRILVHILALSHLFRNREELDQDISETVYVMY